jgi:RNA polymerase sigma factor (sigma-70 family)
VDASDYTQYRPLMFSIAYRMTGSVSDAEDLVQEAFLRATKDKKPENLKAYLATITTRLAIDHLRTMALGASLQAAWVNGQPGLLASDADGALIAVISLDVLDGQVQAIRTVANPEKLSHLGPVSQVWHLRSDG